MRAVASVIIPAHNEENTIARCLDQLLLGTAPGEFEVIVVCNGCTDDTAGTAARPGVEVIEIETASKVAALNAGDRAATVFPRVFLDADITVAAGAVRAVSAALQVGDRAGAPRPVVDTSRSGPLIRAYFSIWSRLGYARHNVVGSGLYAVSEQGRARFDVFPDVIADDGFIYCLFDADERVNPASETFTISAPRTVRALIKRRIRIDAGNRELRAVTGRAPEPAGPFWADVLRQDPRRAGAVLIYLAINATAGLQANRRARLGTSGAWHQDRTSRQEQAVRNRGRAAPLRSLLQLRTWRQLIRVANFFRYDGAELGKATVDPSARVTPVLSVRNGQRITIGAGAHIGQWDSLWAGDHTGRIVIGRNAVLAPFVFITASNYDFDAGPERVSDLPRREADVHIGENTWLGAHVVVVPGVTIGDGTIVAAGSVVTRDLPAGVVAAGVPARVIRERGSVSLHNTG